LLPKPHPLGIWIHTWLVMLSHAECHTSLPSL
jgi:hypothetical protein